MTLFLPEVRTSTSPQLVCIWVRTTDRRHPLRSVWITQPLQPLTASEIAARTEGGGRCA